MAVTAFWFANAFVSAFNKEIDWVTDDIAITLHTSAFTPNQDTMDYFNDLTNQLATANGYTAEDGTGTGKLMGTKTSDNTLNVFANDGENTVWTSSGAGFTARRAVASDVTTNVTTTDPVISWVDFGQDETASGGGTFTITWDAAGVQVITAVDATGFP